MRHPGRCSSRFVVRGTGHTLLLPLFWLILAHADGAECVWSTHNSCECADVSVDVTAVHASTPVLQACKHSSVTYGWQSTLATKQCCFQKSCVSYLVGYELLHSSDPCQLLAGAHLYWSCMAVRLRSAYKADAVALSMHFVGC